MHTYIYTYILCSYNYLNTILNINYSIHTVALVEDGSPSRALYSWGRNHKGQLGQGFESVMEMTPRAIDFSKVTNFKLKRNQYLKLFN